MTPQTARRTTNYRGSLGFVVLVLAACGGDDNDADEREPEVLEQPSAISPTCEPPPDCLPIVSLINIGVCCSDTLRCGFDLSPVAAVGPMYPELKGVFEVDPEKPCVPRSQAFLELPRPEPTRIVVDAGPDVLITPSCTGRGFTTTPLAGCCLPNNACGYDTHLVRSTFVALSKASDVAFTQPECLTASELNAQLTANGLAAWAYLPAATGTCDYAALDAMLSTP